MTITNHNKHLRAFLKICIQNFFSHSNKIITFFLIHGIQEKFYGPETALKPWPKNEPKKQIFFRTHNINMVVYILAT